MAEQIAIDVLVKDVNASRNLNKVGDAAEDAGDDFKGMAKDSALLARQIEDVEDHLRELRTEFAKTGDLSLKKIISANERDLAFLQKIKKSLADIGDDAGKKAGKTFVSGLADTFQALPAQLKGAAITGLVGIGAATAPFLGAAISGAVLGGVGAGGIIGGIALAARDNRVEAAGSELADQFMSGLQSSGQPFVGPILDALDRFEDTQRTVLVSLGKSFATLAPLVTPVAKGVDGLARNILPGLEKAATKSAVPVRALANELPELGDAVSDALGSISDESDSAAEGVIGFSDAMEFAIRRGGEWIAYLGFLYGKIVEVGDAAHDAGEDGGPLGWLVGAAGGPLTGGWLLEEFDSQVTALEAAKDASYDYAGAMREVVTETERARESQIVFAQSIEDQFDPTLNLIHRLNDVKDAQREYNEAVGEHGRNSREAKDANLAMTEAILRANVAAATASGTFSGKLDPSLRATLKAGGMTEAQLNQLERQANATRAALLRYEDVYTAKVKTEFYEYRAGERNPSGRASGGPVAAGQTYWVGENGPELYTATSNGYIHTAAASQSMAAGGSAVGRSAGGASVSVSLRDPDTALGKALAAWIVPYLQFEVMNQGGDVDGVLSAPRR